jgi:hypothetical protein
MNISATLSTKAGIKKTSCYNRRQGLQPLTGLNKKPPAFKLMALSIVLVLSTLLLPLSRNNRDKQGIGA